MNQPFRRDPIRDQQAETSDRYDPGFMAQKMTVEFADGADPAAVMLKVREACKKVEPDCEVFI